MLVRALACCLLSLSVLAGNDLSFDADPYLEYRPAFVRSLPVQILLTGVVLTLTAVLFIYLMFTAQYHWPLAPVNYVLQVSGVTTLLISLIATLHVVLSICAKESRKWPFMLSYVAVNVPPLDGFTNHLGWSTAERATWLIMNATTSGLIQVTHIQFLTLLYPSKTEGILIFAMLGPLAILAAIMHLLHIQGSPDLDEVAGTIRNICHATLSLLFTTALFVWGLLVNREQAWRTDGGTAGFGCAALFLALASTALTFMYIPREEEFVWLPGLIWAVVQWQSFLGWWWWVGAGTGTDMPRYDSSEYLEHRDRKKAKRKRSGRDVPQGTPRERARRAWQSVFASLSERSSETEGPVRRRRRSRHSSHSGSPVLPIPDVADTPSLPDALSEYTGTLPRILPGAIHRWYDSLRQAHIQAARKQAIERVERIRERERAGIPASTSHGWGLGSYAFRRQENEEQDYSRGRRPASIIPIESIELREVSRRDEDEGFDEQLGDTVTHSRRINPPESSIWWWGPLRRWRLQDSTTY